MVFFLVLVLMFGAGALAANNPPVRGAGAGASKRNLAGAGAAAAGVANRPPAGVGAGGLNIPLAPKAGAGVVLNAADAEASKPEGAGKLIPNDAAGACAGVPNDAGACAGGLNVAGTGGAGAACGGAWSRSWFSKRRSAASS